MAEEVTKSKKTNIGIEAMIDQAMHSYEKLPMLEVVFEKFIRLCSVTLRNLTEDNVDLDIKSIKSMRFNQYINTIPTPSLVTIFRAREWDNFGLFVPDNIFVFSMLDVLFGGKKIKNSSKPENRAYTSIEQSLVKQISESCFEIISESFEALSPVRISFERMETDPRFASISRPSDPVVLIEISVKLENGEDGKMDFLFPYETLEPIKEQLLQVFIGEQFGVDCEWEEALTKKITSTNITLQAEINGRPTSMQDVANLKIGSTIMMQNLVDDDISIICNGAIVTNGKLGRMGNKIAISVNKSIEEFKRDNNEANDIN